MVNRRAAGSRFEKKIQEYLISMGWATEKARASVIWIKNKKAAPGGRDLIPISTHHDFFSCVDVLAVHPEKPYTLMVQATIDHSDASMHRKKIEAIKWNHAAQRVQLWSRQSGMVGGVRIEELTPAGWISHEPFRLKDGQAVPEGVL